MKKGIHILKELCCGLTLLGSTVVTASGSVDLGFLENPDISKEVEVFFSATYRNLNFTEGMNPGRIREWMADPTHRRKGPHPLRICLGGSLRQGNRFYSQLMQGANRVLETLQEVIHSVPIVTINGAFEASDKRNRGEPEVHVVLGLPAESLQHWKFANDAIVQVASQFNALESTSSEIAPLPNWLQDPTQGPGACMQALAGTALRCAAQQKGKLPDAILPLLQEMPSIERQSILEKYPNLYRNGYLNLLAIEDLEILRAFTEYMEANIGQLRMQAQWVKCEESKTRQLQVFSAASSFQDASVDWDGTDDCTNYYKKISIALLSAQYKALAQMARLSGRPLHLTAVGMGAFNNPPEALDTALGTVLQVLEGSGVKVFLHGYSLNDIGKWNRALEASDYKPVQFDFKGPEFNPIVRTQKIALPQPVSLDFFSHPHIPGQLEQLSSLTRSQLSLPGRINWERISQWKSDPTHQKEAEHPLRTRIRRSFNGEKEMQDARGLFSEMQEPVVTSISLEDTEYMANESRVHVVLGLPVESLQHWQEADGAIVQVASQFNALESNFQGFTPLQNWVEIRAQGAGVCMQALSAAALRCAAHEQGQLPDAILPLLQGCNVGGQLILQKYPKLYSDGHLNLLAIDNPKDLETFVNHIEANAKKLKIQTQWVRCEESGTVQLQVFCGAPGFSKQHVDWNRTDARTNCYKRASTALLNAQYEILARMARLSGRSLHLTLVGMGILNNPPEVLNVVLKTVLERLEGSGVKVFLHGYNLDDVKKWNRALEASGYEQVQFNPEVPEFNPIAQAQKRT